MGWGNWEGVGKATAAPAEQHTCLAFCFSSIVTVPKEVLQHCCSALWFKSYCRGGTACINSPSCRNLQPEKKEERLERFCVVYMYKLYRNLFESNVLDWKHYSKYLLPTKVSWKREHCYFLQHNIQLNFLVMRPTLLKPKDGRNNRILVEFWTNSKNVVQLLCTVLHFAHWLHSLLGTVSGSRLISVVLGVQCTVHHFKRHCVQLTVLYWALHIFSAMCSFI